MIAVISHRSRTGQAHLSLLWRALSVGILLFFGLMALGGPVAAATATFSPDTAASELMRLLNGERTTHGLPALSVDAFLVDKARDGVVVCPNGSGTMSGRAKDMAVNNYFSHALRLCPSYSFADAMHAWGYNSSIGEIIAMNNGYNFNSYPYQFGCDVAQDNCTGTNTSAPTTVAQASYQFITSQSHRDIVLSTHYDRFACGAWQTSYGAFYACIFSLGPGTPPAPAATPTPTPPPVVAPTPPPPVVTPTPHPVVTPTSTPHPVVTPMPTAHPIVTPMPTLHPSAAPTSTPRASVTPSSVSRPLTTPTPSRAPGLSEPSGPTSSPLASETPVSSAEPTAAAAPTAPKSNATIDYHFGTLIHLQITAPDTRGLVTMRIYLGGRQIAIITWQLAGQTAA